MSALVRGRATRGLAALLALAMLALPLAAAGTAFAQSSSDKITRRDCEQGSIRDKSGKPISKKRCLRLVGKRVKVAQTGLARTGFDVWPFVVGGALCLAGAAWFGLRGPGAVRRN
jgi:hypothetical protein